MTNEEKLEHFSEVIRDAAVEDHNRMIEEYKAANEQILNQHKEEAKRKAELKIQLSKESLRKDKSIQIAKQQIAIKKQVGSRQEQLKASLFAEVKNELEQYMATKEYQDYLVKAIQDARAFAGTDEMIIYIDPADEEKKYSLEMATNTQIQISEVSFFGGIQAEIRSKNILIDQTFQTKLLEAESQFTFSNL